MKPILAAALVALSLSQVPAWSHTATIYTDNTLPSTQLMLSVLPGEAQYWDGSQVTLQISGAGYSCPGGVSAGATLLIHILVDGVEVGTASLPWGCYLANRITNCVSLLGLPVGNHVITVQYNDSVEYYTQYIYTGSYTHREFFTTYTHTYYTRNHYWTTPCSASAPVTIRPATNFRKVLVSPTNGSVAISYRAIPTNTYSLMFSTDLANWHLLTTGRTGTNGQVRFFDNHYPYPVYYRVFGP